jgi:hypothetical protein
VELELEVELELGLAQAHMVQVQELELAQEVVLVALELVQALGHRRRGKIIDKSRKRNLQSYPQYPQHWQDASELPLSHSIQETAKDLHPSGQLALAPTTVAP